MLFLFYSNKVMKLKIKYHAYKMNKFSYKSNQKRKDNNNNC